MVIADETIPDSAWSLMNDRWERRGVVTVSKWMLDDRQIGPDDGVYKVFYEAIPEIQIPSPPFYPGLSDRFLF